ncbi:MAG: galactokinase [Anaerolineae bacterium]|nr:galactokinase [Anaerolineae bacterium]
MSQAELYDKVVKAFQLRFQHKPQLVVRAPGRVNLIGEHTDYNDGFVMPMAVDRAAWLAVSATEEPWATLRALDMGGDEAIFPVDQIPASVGGWSDYPKAIVWALHERNLKPVGINAVFSSDVPVGAGMSSSAAVEVSFGYAWMKLSDFELELPDLALLAQRAENEYVGVNCGIMDQMISACGRDGHAMLLDTRTLKRGYFPMPEGVAVVVADSLVRRSLANSEYNVRRSQCEQAVSILQEHLPGIKALRDVNPDQLVSLGHMLPDVVLRRARHVVHENARVAQVARALRAGQLETVGKLLVEGHHSLRDDYEVSAPELDALVDAAIEVEGCYGARLTGAGFGGCVIVLVAEDNVSELKSHLTSRYQELFDTQPRVYITHPANGVSEV